MSELNSKPIPEIYSEIVSESGHSFKEIIQMVRDDPNPYDIGAAWVVDAFFADGNYHLLRGGFSKAAKNHVCDWCGMEISKDDKYMNASVKFDDESGINNYKVCLDCVEALQAEEFDGGDDIIEWRKELNNTLEAKPW